MATETITGASITINTVDVSSQVKKVTLRKTFDTKEGTGFQETAKVRKAGLADIELEIDWLFDYGSGSVEDTLNTAAGTVVAYIVKKDSGTTTASNPSYTGNCIVTEVPAIEAEMGEIHETSTTWPGDGDWTRATS